MAYLRKIEPRTYRRHLFAIGFSDTHRIGSQYSIDRISFGIILSAFGTLERWT